VSTTATAPAGWYSNPSDETTQRWWNGIAWTEHVSAGPPVPLVAAVPLLPSVPSEPLVASVPSVPAIPSVPWAQTGYDNRATATAWVPTTVQSPNTVWIWLLAFGLFISAFSVVVAQGLLLAIVGAGSSAPVAIIVGFIIGLAPVWVFAGLDIRALRHRGFQTASILFMLLIPPLVYFAARARMLKRDGVRSRGPEIAFLIVMAISLGSRIIGAIGAVSVLGSSL
jgi:hypothetical protein